MAEVEARRAAYLDDGWSDVVILERGQHFNRWQHSHAPKRKGGRVYVEVHDSGEVIFHEAWLTEKEAAARARGEKGEAPARVARPEVTSAMNSYIDLHRHAAVRAELAKHGGVALRALAAHVIASSDHYRVEVQSYVCAKDEVQESVETCAAEVMFDERRRAVLAVLGFDGEDLTVTARRAGQRQFAPIFARLLELPDPVVLEILGIVMGETLAAGSEAIEMIGQYLDVDMAKLWTPDAAFWGLVRDKDVLGKIVAEVAGADVAAANAGQQAKVLKTIVVDHLDGANGRPKVEGWVPRWMRFAPSPYTARGGVASVAAHDRLLHILARAAEAEAVREVADAIVEADPNESTDLREGAVTEAAADAADEGDGADAGGDTALAA
jgi:ParB family chromosome partitioning protein